MTYYLTSVLLLLSLLAAQLNAEPIRCLSCPRVSKPEDCRVDLLCAEGEICQTQKYITDEGNVFYELGCNQVDVCKSANYLVGTDELRARINSSRAYPLVGRRQLENIAAYVCIECCDTPFCNNFLCGGHETGLECAICDNVAHLDECNQIEVCAPHQSCYVEEMITDTFELRYLAKCLGDIQCNVLLKEQQTNGLQGLCKRCCSQNMCNTICSEPPSTTSLWTTPPPSTAAVTTKTLITHTQSTTTLAQVTQKVTTQPPSSTSEYIPNTQAMKTTGAPTPMPVTSTAPPDTTTKAQVTDKLTSELIPNTQAITTTGAPTPMPVTSTAPPDTTKAQITDKLTSELVPNTQAITTTGAPTPMPVTSTAPPDTTKAKITDKLTSELVPNTQAITTTGAPTPRPETTAATTTVKSVTSPTTAPTTTPTTTTTTTVCPTLPYLSHLAPPSLLTNILHGVGCKEKADIAFLLDSSENFNEFDEKQLLRFVEGYTSSLDIGPEGTRVSLTLYNKFPHTYITFDNDGESQENVSVHLDHITSRNDLTKFESNLPQALKKVHEEFDNSSRPDARKYMVILTQDNITDIDRAVHIARTIKNDTVTVFVIGIGKFEGMMDQLTHMVSSPPEQHLVKIKYADDLSSVLEDLILGHCRGQRNPQVQPCWENTEFHKDTCKAEEDTLVILDTSSNIKDHDWEEIKQYLNVFLFQYDVSTNNSKLGLLTYNIGVKTVFPFQPFSDKLHILQKVKQELDNQVLAGPGFTDVALERALKLFQNDHRDAIKNVILFTNGKSVHKMRTLTAALQLQRYGVNVYVVGVGENIDLKEQMILASNPDVDHVLKIGGSSDLKIHLEYMAAKKCNKKLSSTPST